MGKAIPHNLLAEAIITSAFAVSFEVTLFISLLLLAYELLRG